MRDRRAALGRSSRPRTRERRAPPERRQTIGADRFPTRFPASTHVRPIVLAEPPCTMHAPPSPASARDRWKKLAAAFNDFRWQASGDVGLAKCRSWPTVKPAHLL